MIGPEFDDYGPDLDAGPTVSDEVRRIWDSELADETVVAIQDTMQFLDAIDAIILPDSDDDADYRSDEYGTDDGIEVALEQCPFDIDELLDNVH